MLRILREMGEAIKHFVAKCILRRTPHPTRSFAVLGVNSTLGWIVGLSLLLWVWVTISFLRLRSPRRKRRCWVGAVALVVIIGRAVWRRFQAKE